jgi:ribosomal-protein-alanine N-acetyltransferase
VLKGFLIYSGPDWCIEDLVVDPESRRIGVGRSLIRELVARVQQGEKIFLEVRSKNIGAIALYKSENFVQVGIRRGYYGDDDAIIMERVV